MVVIGNALPALTSANIFLLGESPLDKSGAPILAFEPNWRFAMRIVKTAKVAAQNILGPRLTDLVRRAFRPRLRSLVAYRSALESKCGLEIGGPSPMLAEGGQIPIYDVLESLDNCLYSGKTIWAGEVLEGETFHYHPGKQPGRQIISDATDLNSIKDSAYGCVIACHSLEHIANPIRALQEWKRVLEPDGVLLLILPHKDRTFDWRRPVTPLGHMIEDYENSVGEDDLTHLPEILELHDLSKDLLAGTKEQFERRCLDNRINRAMHHHVFDSMAAIAIVNYVGLKILHAESLKPYHIVILSSHVHQPIDNHEFTERRSQHWKRSPFPSDQNYRGG